MSESSGKKLHTQPGAHTNSAQSGQASNQQPQTSVHPVEPEDPKATGTSHSQRQALDLNVGRQQDDDHAGQSGHQAEEHPSTPPGQHATGSFTDKKRRTA